MGTQATYPLVSSVITTEEVVVPDASGAASASPLDAFLGFGLITPMRRDGRGDWANAGGIELVKSSIRLIIGTRGPFGTIQGELPWRTAFGSATHVLRHRNNDEDLEEFARIYVIEAIERWEPRAKVTDVVVSREETPFGKPTLLRIVVFFRLIQKNVRGNQVLLEEHSVEVLTQLAA
jgi:uncharacterized protein